MFRFYILSLISCLGNVYYYTLDDGSQTKMCVFLRKDLKDSYKLKLIKDEEKINPKAEEDVKKNENEYNLTKVDALSILKELKIDNSNIPFNIDLYQAFISPKIENEIFKNFIKFFLQYEKRFELYSHIMVEIPISKKIYSFYKPSLDLNYIIKEIKDLQVLINTLQHPIIFNIRKRKNFKQYKKLRKHFLDLDIKICKKLDEIKTFLLECHYKEYLDNKTVGNKKETDKIILEIDNSEFKFDEAKIMKAVIGFYKDINNFKNEFVVYENEFLRLSKEDWKLENRKESTVDNFNIINELI
ncbi:uncharacterized protein VNE69_08027 [Vairimorpha necatrix]|uniref:Uncharacterized protein n=1 Tax=Vairimorpha necatrix TaxID=6039 RepID=A0AAX4JEB3_9MICR